MSENTPTPELEQPPKKRRKGCLIAWGVFAIVVVVLAVWVGPIVRDGIKSGMFDAYLHPRVNEKYSATSQENLKALYKALSLYHDSEGQFPDSSGWMDAIETRINTYNLAKGEAEKKLIRPDLLGQDGKFGYAMNDAVSGKYKDDVKDQDTTPLIFESKETGRNAHGDPAKIGDGWAISVDGKIIKPDKS